jgi:hypothetical protein
VVPATLGTEEKRFRAGPVSRVFIGAKVRTQQLTTGHRLRSIGCLFSLPSRCFHI